jgi:SAM-dependent methyltransferase
MVKNKKSKLNNKILNLINNKKSVRIDLACGANKQDEDWIGVDVRPLKGVDIVHNLEVFPYPIPDECASSILCSHYVEHINPANFGVVNFFNEVWRIAKPHASFLIACPYGVSRGFVQDPTHCKPYNEITFTYFDPTAPTGFWGIYRPKPWKIIKASWHTEGNMEVVLQKIPDSEFKIEPDGNIIMDKRWLGIQTQYN